MSLWSVIIEEVLDKEKKLLLNEFKQFILENELGFITETPYLFPKIQIHWSSPHLIHNAILDFNENIYDYQKVLRQLLELGCHHIQFRFFKEYDLNFFRVIMETVPEIKNFHSIEFIVKYHSSFLPENLKLFFIENQVISLFYIYSVPKLKLRNTKLPFGNTTKLILVKEDDLTYNQCGRICIKNMVIPDIKEFCENKLYNSCLHGKISVDMNGNIKNCPSMSLSFGDCEKISIKSVLGNPKYIKYGQINKDRVKICKDCEYRYMCHDCRAYTYNDALYGKPLKCSYDPYLGEWL